MRHASFIQGPTPMRLLLQRQQQQPSMHQYRSKSGSACETQRHHRHGKHFVRRPDAR